MNRIVKSGQGWRLGYCPDIDRSQDNSGSQGNTSLTFVGLIGADDWAFELTDAEFRDFRRLLVQLDETLHQMSGELMDEENITCEVESECLWMEAAGFSHAYRIRVILNTGVVKENGCLRLFPNFSELLKPLTFFKSRMGHARPGKISRIGRPETRVEKHHHNYSNARPLAKTTSR